MVRSGRRRPPPNAPAKPSAVGAELREDELRDRFEGRPLLLILEGYVLSVVGEFSAEQSDAMRELVRGIWGGGADWVATLREKLLDETMDAQILRNWQAYRSAMQEQGKPVSAPAFARMFADAIDEQTREPE